jgi:hypothetical protein
MASLVQALCLEQRKAALFLKRNSDEGVIYFDDGGITHASLGPLLGEDAVYELVTWTEGTFRIGDYDVLPRRTVASDWNYLLMEGMRRMDEYQAEASSHARTENLLSLTEIEHDRNLETKLIALLSKLEHARARLTDMKANRGQDLTLQLLSGMATSVLDSGKSLQVMPAQQEFYKSALVSMEEKARSSSPFSNNKPDFVQHSNRNDKDHSTLIDRQPTVGEIGENVAILLEGFFSIFSAQFVSSTVADRWIEASAVFLKDFAKTLENAQL